MAFLFSPGIFEKQKPAGTSRNKRSRSARRFAFSAKSAAQAQPRSDCDDDCNIE